MVTPLSNIYNQASVAFKAVGQPTVPHMADSESRIRGDPRPLLPRGPAPSNDGLRHRELPKLQRLVANPAKCSLAGVGARSAKDLRSRYPLPALGVRREEP